MPPASTLAASCRPARFSTSPSGVPRRLRDVLARLIELAGVEVRIETDAQRLRPTDIPTACGDASAARQKLGWEPRIAWDQTLADLLADWRDRVAREPGES